MFGKFLFFVCCTGAYTQILPSCRQYDFDDEYSLYEFEPCDDVPNVFGITLYADVPIEPFRFNAEKHLRNIQTGYTCLRTRQAFNFDSYTEVDSVIYLNSDPEDSQSYVEILAVRRENGSVYSLGKVTPSVEWNMFHNIFTSYLSNAQIEIHAFTTANALLAIEYLHIVNPRKAEPDCRRTTTSTTTRTTSTTSTSTTITTTEPETDPTTEPTTVETKPTNIETEPTTIETEPTAIETEPTTTETEQTTIETEVTTIETEPTTIEVETPSTGRPIFPIDSNEDTVWIIQCILFHMGKLDNCPWRPKKVLGQIELTLNFKLSLNSNQ